MKESTKFTPLFTRFSAALLLSVAMVSPPAIGGGLIGSCKSYVDGVSTHYTTPMHKKCGGGWDGCLTSIVLDHDAMRFTAVDFRQPDYSGQLTVAVLPNDSRLGRTAISPATATGPGESNLQGQFRYVENGTWQQNWQRFGFTGLMPEHHYAVVIYGTEDGHSMTTPFYRQCFWTDDDPANCPPDALRNYHGVAQC